MVAAEWGVFGRVEYCGTEYLFRSILIGPEIFGVGDDVQINNGRFAGLEVLGLEFVRSNFVGTDDDAVFSDLAGVG